MKDSIHISVVQSGPVYLDLAASMQKAIGFVEEAAAKGTNLLVFGECWLSGYPVWLDICPEAALWDHEPVKEVFARMHLSSITVPGPETETFGELARKHNMTICIGANERIDFGPGNGTIYNTLLIFGSDGKIARHHRKLRPTYGERLVHGSGDGAGLDAVDSEWGRIGGLICWEHWMPLTRQAMHDSGEHIHLALWPQVKEMNVVASRQYAFEGRCFVISAGQVMRASELPSELDSMAMGLPEELKENPDSLIMKGGTSAFAPDGSVLLPPQYDKEGLIHIHLDDLQMTIRERMNLDVSGHYQRRDVFRFEVDKGRL